MRRSPHLLRTVARAGVGSRLPGAVTLTADGRGGERVARAPVALCERRCAGALVAVGGLLEQPRGRVVVSARRGQACEQVRDRADVAAAARGHDDPV